MLNEDNWKAFEYEVEMFHEARQLMRRGLGRIAKNSAVESALLHTRILIEALLSRGKKSDDITLAVLLQTARRPERLETALAKLEACYGTNAAGTPCWTLNKRLAHLTKERGDSYNYQRLLDTVDPLVQEVLDVALPLLGRPKLDRYVTKP